jgi:hypothetical protein
MLKMFQRFTEVKGNIESCSLKELEDIKKELALALSDIQAELLRREKVQVFQETLKKEMQRVKTKTIKNYAIATEDEESASSSGEEDETVGTSEKMKKKTIKKAITKPKAAVATKMETKEEPVDRYKGWTIPKMLAFMDKQKVDYPKGKKKDEYIEYIRSKNLVREMHKYVEA